jgi:chromosome segregation ATPase
MSKTKAQLTSELRSLRVLLAQANNRHQEACEIISDLNGVIDQLKPEVTRLHESNQTLQQNLLTLMEEKKPWYKRISL